MEIVLSIIIGIVIAIVVVYLIWKQPIRISYSVNRYALVITNFCTFLDEKLTKFLIIFS